LNPAETAALIRVFVEAFWNVAKHSGASNMYLESRRVGSVLIVRVRGDGRGFDTANPHQASVWNTCAGVPGGRRGSGRDLHPWTRYFGAGKVPQAPEHRQPVAGRSDRLHEAEQNVADSKGRERWSNPRSSAPTSAAIICGCVRSSGW
jgi:hypothetical protein